MKIKSDFILREVAGTYVVVPVGKRADEFNGMVNLNETGAFFWKLAEKGCTREEMINACLDTYNVDQAILERDIDKFIQTLTDNSLFEQV
ncbi:MAG: PqqD family protein [Lachnospiraceae bacterium]|nr:PqqD family protein [Lachnospiraceae bacterium]